MSLVLLLAGASAQQYSFNAEAGSFSVSGINASLTKDIFLNANAGSFSADGVIISFEVQKVISAEVVNYSASGLSANLDRTYSVAVDAGSYAVSGLDAIVATDKFINAAAGTYLFTGIASTLEDSGDKTLGADPANYSVTGIDASRIYIRLFEASPASYVATGKFPVNIDGYISASQYSQTRILGINDFSTAVDDAVNYWKLEGEKGENDYVTLPMQYLKITAWSYRENLPFGGTNYAEVMIPVASEYATEINDSYSFKIKRFFKLPNGTNFEQTFFNFSSYMSPSIPLTKEFTSGSNQDSCMVKGAFRLFESVPAFLEETRVIDNVRSYTSGGGKKKVVCSIDPIIQPGMLVTVGADTFQAKTISFYVSANDQYMEVYDTHI